MLRDNVFGLQYSLEYIFFHKRVKHIFENTIFIYNSNYIFAQTKQILASKIIEISAIFKKATFFTEFSHLTLVIIFKNAREDELCLTMPRLGEVVSWRCWRADAAFLVFAVCETARGALIRGATATVKRIVSLCMTGRRCVGMRQSTMMQLGVSRVARGGMLRRQHRDTGCAAATVHPHR